MTNLYVATDHALAVIRLQGEQARCELHLNHRKVQCVAVDCLRPQWLYCGTFGHGLWRSDNGGRDWRPAGAGIRHDKVLSVAVDPSLRVGNHGMVYVGTEPSAIFRSENGGDTWHECQGLTDLPSSSQWSFPPRPQTHHVRWIHPDPHREAHLWVAIEAGALVHSSDAGKNWTDRVPTGPIDTHQLATHDSAPGRLYSAAGDGYFESIDNGETWRKIEDGLEHRYVWSVAVDLGNPETRIVAAAASPRHSHDQDRAESFIYRRTAHGPWQQVREGLADSSDRRTAVLASHPTESGVFFAVWESDLYRSTDGGATWDQLYVPWPEGFRVGEPRGLAIRP